MVIKSWFRIKDNLKVISICSWLWSILMKISWKWMPYSNSSTFAGAKEKNNFPQRFIHKWKLKKKVSFQEKKKKRMLDYRKGVHLVEDYYKTTFTGLLEVSRKKIKRKKNPTPLMSKYRLPLGSQHYFSNSFFHLSSAFTRHQPLQQLCFFFNTGKILFYNPCRYWLQCLYLNFDYFLPLCNSFQNNIPQLLKAMP